MSEALARTGLLRWSERPRATTDPVEVTASAARVPAWRGLVHEKAFALSPALGVLLVLVADGGGAAKLAAAVFALTMTCMFAASALNHRTSVSLRWEHTFRRADHTAILLFLAGTSTSVALVALSGATRLVLVAAVWGATIVACSVTIAWLRVPGWLMAAFVLGAGWVAAGALAYLGSGVRSGGIVALFLGGLIYTAGGVGYALRRPNPHPAFAYHEVFHLLVLVGVACHYVALAFLVLPTSA